MNNFPDNFYWGAATSAHQVEGNNHNDWIEFERQTANGQAQMARRKRWPDYILDSYPNPLQGENYISGKACDHYNRFREDFDIAKSLGHNAHRFSIEWSRIEPEEGKFDQKEIGHYREVIQALRERGMEPFVTLWHYTLPLWVSDIGGWENRKTVDYFVRYCERMAKELKTQAQFFITMNEPSLWASNAYRTGNFPPAKKNWLKFYKVFWNLHRGHCRAYRIMKQINQDFLIGITQNTARVHSLLPIANLYYYLNIFFLKTISDTMDFIGLDYYRGISFGKKPFQTSNLGWEIYPEGLHQILKKIYSFKLPIFVLENGIADAEDSKRAQYVSLHIDQISRALDEGIDVRGYFYWSLLDNFEWENGFWPRFGLVEVDYKTMERKIRESARIYADIILNSKS